MQPFNEQFNSPQVKNNPQSTEMNIGLSTQSPHSRSLQDQLFKLTTSEEDSTDKIRSFRVIQGLDERELIQIVKEDPNFSSVKLTFFDSKENQYFEYENRNSVVFKSKYALSEAPQTEPKTNPIQQDSAHLPGISNKLEDEPTILKRSTRLKKKIKKYNSYE